MKKKILLLLPVFFIACDMFDYHPYDGKLSGVLDNNKKNIARIEEHLKDKTSFKFAFISDTQRWYDDTERVVKNINSRPDIDFVVHGGDLSDFGYTDEFLLQRDILNKLKAPYVAVIGNHDFLANGSQVFVKVFGEENFSFMAGNTKFVCVNTNALELDYSHPVPDFQYINSQLDENYANHTNTIFVMHAPPFSEQFNNNVAKVFQYEINRFPNLLFCLNGHGHTLEHNDLFDDGVIYYEVCNVHKRKYYIFTITDNKYTYEVVEF